MNTRVPIPVPRLYIHIYIDICACNFFSSFCARSVDAFRTVLKRGRGEGPLATPRSHARAPSKFREERGRERLKIRGPNVETRNERIFSYYCCYYLIPR